MTDNRLTTAQRAAFKAPACPSCGHAMKVTWTADTRGTDTETKWDHTAECERCRPCRTCGAAVDVSERLGEPSYGGTRHMVTVRKCTNPQCVMNGPVGNRSLADAV